MIPHLYNRSFTISADLDIPAAGAEGVIVAEADVMGGFSLYVQDSKLHYTYSFLGVKVETLTATEDLPTGKVRFATSSRPTSPENRPPAAAAGCSSTASRSARTTWSTSVPLRFTTYAGMDIGRDNGEPVSPTYRARSPFAFTGKIEKVVFDLHSR